MKNKILRVKIQALLRRVGLLPLTEHLRYRLKVWSLQKQNNSFIEKNPDFNLPPAFLAFDAYSAPDWNFYKTSGEGTAMFLANEIINKHFKQQSSVSVYEWGCGPARVVRHLASKLSNQAIVYGSDYNKETINWCTNNIPRVSFSLNKLNPPLDYEDNKFDFIYSISVFTHLSEVTWL